jgi:hypothetical protein
MDRQDTPHAPRQDGPERGRRGLADRIRPGARRGPGQQHGRRVFRLPGPLVVWWIWAVFAVANLIDLAITGRDWDSVVVVVVLALITGFVYVLAFRPSVIADDDGLVVRNPFRDHHVPWGGVNSVGVRDSVQVRCQVAGRDTEKVVHSWALYASRRARVRGRAPRRRSVFAAGAPLGSSKMPREAQELVKQSAAEAVATELELRHQMARQDGTREGTWSGRWPWQPAAAVLAPGLALLIVLLVH